jgi:glycosyltransferase involved in cell wall biosynthesis
VDVLSESDNGRLRAMDDSRMQISVVLTTYNRPGLLVESVKSVLDQTWPRWELVIVDNGSSTPVTRESAGASAASDKVRVVRHEGERSPSAARNAGMASAAHDLIFFLDDDDLLAPDTLQKIHDAFASMDNIDCLFLNVAPFGPLAEGTLKNQEAAMDRILGAMGTDARAGLIAIDKPHALFVALLKGLPMAFQRPVIKKSTLLSKVGAYTGEGFGDMEMYYRVALRCRSAVLLDPVYRVRCEGQSHFSRIDAQAAMLDAVIKIRRDLLLLPEIANDNSLARHVRDSLSTAYFERAYLAHMRGAPFPWGDFGRSIRGGLGWRHLSLLCKVPLRSRSASKSH